jgi:hypothetical protein
VLQHAEKAHYLHQATPRTSSKDQPCTLNLQVFGVDFIFRASDNQPFFIEANTAPQFQDSFAMDSLRDTFGLPMVAGAADVMEAVAEAEKERKMSQDLFAKEDPKPSTWACCGTLTLKDLNAPIELDEVLMH